VELHDSAPRPGTVRGGPGVAFDGSHLVPSPGQAGPEEQPGGARADNRYAHHNHLLLVHW
jgi:hypothetical protein